MLAAALDLPYAPIQRAEVSAQAGSPSAPLLQAWLRNCLDVPVDAHRSRGPGITGVVLHTTDGPIELTRPDGRTGRLARPGIATHDVPLARRDLRDLIGEELSRLDPDDTYGAALAALDLPKAPVRRRRAKSTAEAEA
jgi:glucose-6-phosphate dehydrogenase assembly protein OpcA